MNLLSRFWIFLRERHDPFSITLLVAAFFGANAVMGASPRAVAGLPPWHLLCGYALVWLVFLHMRMFDEVKDHATDCQYNPERPLARGLLSLGEFGALTLGVILLELALALSLGFPVFTVWVSLLAFTLVMRQEFFVGDWLRPRLEAYAITHTFSAALLGTLSQAVVTGRSLADLEGAFLPFALGNWFIFNVFEFGRKTFGADEERPGVDSYSNRLQPWGAVVLLVINLLVGFGLLLQAAHLRFGVVPAALAGSAGSLVVLVLAVGAIYAGKPTRTWARVYRGTVTFFLLGYHLAVIGGLVWS